jgi:hypothetical protein
MISKAYAADIITEYSGTLDEDSMYDIVREVADGSEHVIYYDKARELVNSLTMDDLNDAEEQVKVWVSEFISYNEHAERLAYYALHTAIMEALQELMQQQQKEEEEDK